MNRLSAPVTLLAVVLIAVVAWFVWAHQQTVTPIQNQPVIAASPTAAAQTTPTTPTPTDLDPATVAQNIVGSWQSADDPKYSVAVTANGAWTDSYEGADASSSISETGTYELFTSADPDKDFTGALVPGVVYLKVSEGDSTLYYGVLAADGTTLQLNYLARGTMLSFVKER